MNKTAFLLAASITLTATAPTAYAAGQIYGKLGVNRSSATSISFTELSEDTRFLRWDADSGLMPEFALGYDLGNGFAVEFNYQKSGGAAKESVYAYTYERYNGEDYEDVERVRRNRFAGGDLVFTSTMVKGIYNIQTNNTDWYNPYIGIGIGMTNTRIDKVRFDYSDEPDYEEDSARNADGSASSMQLTFGNRFKFNQGWFGDIAANYTRINATTITFEDIDDEYDDDDSKISSSSMTSLSFALGKLF